MSDGRTAPLTGILPIDKPLGWTSHDVVGRVRRVAGQKAVGHAGTLDPLATGLLLVVMGHATKLSSYLMDSTKTYNAEVVLGATTVTDDAEAPLLVCADVGHLEIPTIAGCVQQFVGQIDQVPPAYAAIRQGGTRLYTLARKGIEVRPVPRSVRIDRIDLLQWEPPRLSLQVVCGPGTYIRALARDIGTCLGVGGYLHALRRVGSGSFGQDDMVGLDELTDRDAVEQRLLPPDRAVLHLIAVALSPEQARDISFGRQIRIGGIGRGTVRLYGPSGLLVGLGEAEGDWVKPFRVFPEEMAEDARRHGSG